MQQQKQRCQLPISVT